ncbi:MAG: ABC transporter substrate-binding protein [Gemmatimonadota bacterium]|nr:ABC transporter substrate-binding protein [Gemmatimonadota bacterium]
MRIVSLLPSATEIIASLGLIDSLVGVSHSCDWPPAVLGLPQVTSTMIPKHASPAEIDEAVRERHAAGLPLYEVDERRLSDLAPDLVVTQGLCDVCAVTEAQARAACAGWPAGVEVLSLAPRTVADVFANILDIGMAVSRVVKARTLVAALSRRTDRVVAAVRGADRQPRVTLLEWVTPLYAGGHWTPEIIALAGGKDGHGRVGAPSRRIAWDEVRVWQPEVLVVACCGLDVEAAAGTAVSLAALPGYAELPAVRQRQTWVVDGVGYFSRPGPRLIDSLEWLAGVLHPSLVPQARIPARRLGPVPGSLVPQGKPA